MTDFFSTEGASAYDSQSADYSGNDFSVPVDGSYDAYYIARFADASGYSDASLTGNSITINGSDAPDQVNVAVNITAADNSYAYGDSNNWFVDLGDGDDTGSISTVVMAADAWSSAGISYDSVGLYGGAGADLLLGNHELYAYDGGYAGIDDTSRVIDGGAGNDSLYAETYINATNGGGADYYYNSLTADAGADGGNLAASTHITSTSDAVVNVFDNSATLLGSTNISADVFVDAFAGTVYYSYNSVDAELGSEGGTLAAGFHVSSYFNSYVSIERNSFDLAGGDGADRLISVIELDSGFPGSGMPGGYAEATHNSVSADGGTGDDYVYFGLSGFADLGGQFSITSNDFYATGGDGNDSLNFSVSAYPAGSGEIAMNSAELDGGAGADSLDSFFSDGAHDNYVSLIGGEGDDYIHSFDAGQNNEILVSGGAGNDTIVDDQGFTTAVFSGAQGDYSITSLPLGWISVTDLRDGSPDGSDQLYHVDQFRFSDGDVLVSDLHLPIVGTDGNDTIYGTEGNDVIYGYGGNDLLFPEGGDDALFGGDGQDSLYSYTGVQQMTGGARADTFKFQSVAWSSLEAPDVITDFSGQTVYTTNPSGRVSVMPGEGDKIDLSRIDANVNLDGNQAFTLVQHGFDGTAGEAYSSYDAGTGFTTVYLDVNGDASADMAINLLGDVKLNGADFIL